MRLLSIKVRNFKVLKDLEMRDIPAFVVTIGANGTGKSTLIDVFGFLKDCLVHNVNTAVGRRSGFAQLVSRGHEKENISIELKVRLRNSVGRQRTVTYSLEIGERAGKAVVKVERLQWTRSSKGGKPFRFLDYTEGKGTAVVDKFGPDGTAVPDDQLDREVNDLDAPDILAIKALGQLKRFEEVSQLRELIEGWRVANIVVDDARSMPDVAPAPHLDDTGKNLALYAQYLRDQHPEIFSELIRRAGERIPGLAEVVVEDSGDGRVFMRYRDAAFTKGFIARAVSDGTVKMFAYLALLADPEPHPLLCIEEPENQLYPSLMSVLAEEFAAYAARRNGDAQVFVTTHSPDFLSAVPLDSIFWLRKENGFTKVHRANSDPQLVAFVQEGDKPGWLWRQGLFSGANP